MGLEQQLLELAQQARRKPAPVKKSAAHALLQDADTTATGCIRALESLYGSVVRSWEPESIWLSLQRSSVDTPTVNRDKILAAHTLLMIPAFWWEVNAFENTAMAFNSHAVNPEVLQEATPAMLSWAVYEAELLYTDETPEFDREPVLYTAAVLHRAGYLLAPELLAFAQGELDVLNKNGSGHVTKANVAAAWKDMQKKPVSSRSITDDALGFQLAQLTSVEMYLEEWMKRYTQDLTALGQ
jgi:hypothetical protein